MTGFHKFGSVVFGVALAFGAAANAADVVVLDSNVAALAAGDVVAESKAVSIPAGSQVTLIMSDGETRVVAGPYQGPIGATGAVEGVGIGQIAAGRGGETKVLGAVRAPKWEVAD